MQNKNRGAAMVEFAIVVPFFFMLMLSIVYGALVMLDINSLNEITRDATRYGAVIDSGVADKDGKFTQKEANLQSYIKKKADENLVLYEVKNSSTEEDNEDNPIKVNASDTVSIGDNTDSKENAVTITVTATMKEDSIPKLFDDYFPDDLKTIKSSLTMRRED